MTAQAILKDPRRSECVLSIDVVHLLRHVTSCALRFMKMLQLPKAS